MATKIVTKNSSTAGSAPLASDLVQGELAVNVTDKRLYTENASGTIVEVGTNPSAEIIANGGIALPDNGKATFGAGDDLAMYSTGANGYIENQTGLLILKNNSDDRDIALQSDDGVGGIANYLLADGSTGSLKAYHYGAEKLATTDTGIDVTGNVALGDNGKATFGAGDDLQIYHDGSHSYISDQGTGQLRILASDRTIIYNAAADEVSAQFISGGESQLRYAGSPKLATTSTGIDVTGTATMDGLTVDGDVVVASTVPRLILSETDVTNGNWDFRGSFGNLLIRSLNDDLSTAVSRLGIAAGGDISFYEDTGTTAKFFWDASAESLGIGTSSPASGLHVLKGTADVFRLERDATNDWRFQLTAGALAFRDATNDKERMRIDSSGNVGIGVVPESTWDSGFNALQVGSKGALWSATGASGTWLTRNVYYNGTNFKYIDTDEAAAYEQGADGSHRWSNASSGTADANLTLNERMRIDSSGNVLVGKTAVVVATVGHALLPDGQHRATADGAITAIHNRLNSDGDIIQFRKDSTTAGSIGTAGGEFFIASNGTTNAGLRFRDSGDIIPAVSGGTGSNGQSSLGQAGFRFKDLYLSGTVNASSGNISASQANFSITSSNTAGGNEATLLLTHAGNNSFEIKGGADLIFSADGGTSERARITTAGNFLVGNTTTPSSNNQGAGFINTGASALVQWQSGTTTTSGVSVARFYNPNGNVGSIQLAGTATSYVTSSDQRLKENIADADDAGSKIDAIQVRQYDWKADGSHQDYGMIAQELQAVAPEAVSGDADSEEMMGVDYSKLVPMLIKEIQSLRNRVAQLEG